MNDSLRWVAALLIALAIVALIAFARGTPDHGAPMPSQTAAASVTV